MKDRQYLQREKKMERILDLEKRLVKEGINLEDLINTALEMYIPHPKLGSKEGMVRKLREGFKEAFQDINVCALVIAGLYLEEAGRKGLIPGLSGKEYEKDPVQLIADELLGIQIAQYIAGSRALFEFERFDKKKPGILKKLPPIMDDIIGGLIAGVLVKVCS
jgi:alpha-ribazole phosphatase CobZ